jgi:hypothetical protein
MDIDLRQLAADLREARRRVERDPVTAGEMALKVAGTLAIAVRDLGQRRVTPFVYTLERLKANIAVGVQYIRSQPALLACYASCAATELELLAGPIEAPGAAEVPS